MTQEVVSGLIVAAVGTLAMLIVFALRPDPQFIVGIVVGMALTIALGYLWLAIRAALPAAAESDDVGG